MEQGGNTGATFSFRKLGSDSNGEPKKSSGAGDGNSSQAGGFIDPDLARATAGGPSPGGSEPASSAGTGGEPTGRGRGRPRGSKNARPSEVKQESSLNVNGIEKILYSLHAMGASLFAIPELEITEDEARRISKAIAGVSEQYKVMIDPRRAAQIDLVRELGTIYGSRAIAFYLRKKAENAKPINAAPQRPAPAPSMSPRENVPARPAPPGGVDTGINDPLAGGTHTKKPNGSAPVYTGEDAPLDPNFAGFDPRNIKVAH